jgi:hypothetical protein
MAMKTRVNFPNQNILSHFILIIFPALDKALIYNMDTWTPVSNFKILHGYQSASKIYQPINRHSQQT